MTVPIQAEREEALRLWEAKNAAEDAYTQAYDAACEAKPDIVSKYGELEAALDEQDFDDEDASADAHDALFAKREAELGLTDLAASLEAAEDALQACKHEIMAAWRDGGYVAVRCAKTGVPILWSDEMVNDDETGEVWLRSALGLPPRPVKVEEEEEIEEAA